MKRFTMLVSIALFFSACSTKTIYKNNKLFEIEPKTKRLKTHKVVFRVTKDGNVTLSIRDAKWVSLSYKRCKANSKKLEIAVEALNEQIRINNRD